MELILLDRIKFNVEVDQLLRRLHIDRGSEDAAQVMGLVREAEGIGRPKVLYKEAFIGARGEDYVVIDGVKFTSRILRVNCDSAYRVFPYIATCGKELEEWADSLEDVIENYWAGAIMEMALGAAVKAFNAHLQENFLPGPTSTMNPGSLEDWPISQQRELFSILGNPKDSIGVELTESFLMVPVKSVSGIRFPTEVDFENCQLCPRDGCPGRRMPYDADLYNKRYGK